jgi:DNA-binding transcriptional MerR regulator
MDRTVGDVARSAHVSVRALHHWDAIGLLSPSQRTSAGYRVYGDDDLARLQQVLFFRELGFGLDEVARILNDPAFDRREALLMQRRMLSDKAAHLHRMITAVDVTIDGMEKGTRMDEKDMFEVFGEFDPGLHEDEARKRWGGTDAYKESARRAKGYTKEDWKGFKTATDANNAALVAAMDRGLAADDPRVMDLVEVHRLLIDRWFYPCSHEMHLGLAEMYIADPRFTATYEKMHEGMAQFVRDAIVANAARAK